MDGVEMMRQTPCGIFPALVTPFDELGRLNEAALQRLIDHVVCSGVHGLLTGGTTGEFYALDRDTLRQLIEVTVATAAGRIPVWAAVGAISTREAIAQVRTAEQCGADGVTVLVPMFVLPSEGELYVHYRAVADSTSLPLMLYNNSAKTGVQISPTLLLQLAQIDNIIGIKDSSGDFNVASDYLRLTRGTGFSVMAGRDSLIYSYLCLGAAGAVAACANIVPRLVVKIYEGYAAGDLEGSLRAQDRLVPLREIISQGTIPSVIKEALSLIGLDMGACAPPVLPLSEMNREALRTVLQGMSLPV